MVGSLTGRIALVTGAADGMGRSIVDLFTREGASVIAVDIQQALLEEAHKDNAAVRTIGIDITEVEAPHILHQFVVEHYGALDILVNNAGIAGEFKGILETSEDTYRRVMAVNLDAPFRITRKMAHLLGEKRRGRVISTGSSCSNFAMNGLGAYTISKHAILGMMRVFALELGPMGITVNNLEPGPIVTGLTRDIFAPEDSDEGRRFLSQTTVLGRYGQPVDVAAAALFFASDNSGFVTGQALAVDGGLECFRASPV